MDDMMAKVTAEEAVDRDGALPVLSSSVHMFAYVKTSVRRCTALTTGQTFFKLYGAFCECLRGYAARLSGLVEIEDAGTGAGAETDGAASGIIRDCEAACYALNTAEYCAETVGQLGDIVRGKIDAPYADRVDLEPVADAFHDVIAKAVTRLVASLERALEPALRGFSAIAWGAVEEVDEESPYVRLLANGVRSVVPLVRGLLGRLYFRNFCDKFVASFLPTFHDRVRGAKKISEMGTHPLLDLHSVKPAPPAAERKLPEDGGDDKAGGDDGGAPPPPAYVKFVTARLGDVERLLKLVGTPDDMLVERFKIMWPDGTADDLAAVMALKDVKKADRDHLMGTFGAAPGAEAAKRAKTPPPAKAAASSSPPPTAGTTMDRLGTKMREGFSKGCSNEGGAKSGGGGARTCGGLGWTLGAAGAVAGERLSRS
ncbi:hypothetical protein JL720_3948 [Aureococcus anophagefferens]|nr:hypothetical protein JL720_3948 [Aureococcus anophagefferens]